MADTNSYSSDLKTTPLNELHEQLGAKMVPFAGYSMPVQYPTGVKTEHLHTRSSAGLFDVSHMGQVIVEGPNAASELEQLIPLDLEALASGSQSYGLLTSDHGAIIDDLIIARWQQNTFFIVINAACKYKDIEHLRAHISASTITELTDRALLALQGPKAASVMQSICPEALQLKFMEFGEFTVQGESMFISRSGYTGEDGFEISVPAQLARSFAEHILSFDEVAPIGLGARDSLRLESGLCLYGQDMNDQTNVCEASLVWSIHKNRRANGSKAGNFLGADAIFAAQESGVSKKRVGLSVESKTPVRSGTLLVDANSQEIGEVTSGGFSPSLEKPIAMGYVSSDFAKIGTEIFALVRNKLIPVTVAKTPFVTQNYYRG